MHYKKLSYANDIDAFIPELWARESLIILIENMVAANLVHRDFSNDIANFGDVVNTRRPAVFAAKRKGVNDNVVVQDSTATNVAVKLDQHVHTSFLIRDGEESKSFKSLVDEYLRPAMIAQARYVDRVLLGQYPQFLANFSGELGNFTTSNAKKYLLETRKVMNDKKAPMRPRNLVLNSDTETTLLQLDLFLGANTVGDDGTALREASLGRKMAFDIFMDQNMPIIATGNTAQNGAINNVPGYAIGDTVLTIDGMTGAVVTGNYVVIAGDNVPRRITAHTESLGNTTSITIEAPGLARAVADNAVVSYLAPGAVNNAAGYAVGYDGAIVIDGFSVAPQVGQIITFGTSATGPIYTVLEATTTSLTLDRALEAALADNAAVGLGPKGAYNLALHPAALAMVIRPLAMPKQGTGALSGISNYNSLSMRTVITYDGNKQGHLVTFDMLFGVKVLDVSLGAVLLG